MKAIVSEETKSAIELTILDYIEGWQTGNAGRMEKAVSPVLAKRHPAPDGSIEHLDAKAMIGFTAQGHGIRKTGAEDSLIVISGVYEDIATAELFSDRYVDYLHLAWNGSRWVIVNVLWQHRKKSG